MWKKSVLVVVSVLFLASCGKGLSGNEKLKAPLSAENAVIVDKVWTSREPLNLYRDAKSIRSENSTTTWFEDGEIHIETDLTLVDGNKSKVQITSPIEISNAKISFPAGKVTVKAEGNGKTHEEEFNLPKGDDLDYHLKNGILTVVIKEKAAEFVSNK